MLESPILTVQAKPGMPECQWDNEGHKSRCAGKGEQGMLGCKQDGRRMLECGEVQERVVLVMQARGKAGDAEVPERPGAHDE